MSENIWDDAAPGPSVLLALPDSPLPYAGIGLAGGEANVNVRNPCSLTEEELLFAGQIILGVPQYQAGAWADLTKNQIFTRMKLVRDKVEARDNEHLFQAMVDADALRLATFGSADSFPLTDQEISILNEISRGVLNTEIARRRGVTTPAIDYHLTQAGRRTGYPQTTLLVAGAILTGQLGHELWTAQAPRPRP